MELELLRKALELTQRPQQYAIATIVGATQGTPRKQGAKMIVSEDGTIYDTIGGGTIEKQVQAECLKSITNNAPVLLSYKLKGEKGQQVCGGEIQVFVEPYIGEKKLFICGGGHIAYPLSIMAKMLHFHVTVMDNRKEFANKKRFSHVDKVYCGDPQLLGRQNLNNNCYVVIISHAHTFDFQYLKEALNQDPNYIGVISSQTKKNKFLNELRVLKYKKSKTDKISMPVGIDIGAETPEEIAISIMAEIISIQNKEHLKTEKFIGKKESSDDKR